MCKYCKEKTEIVWGEDDDGIFLSITKDGTLSIYSPEQCSNFEVGVDIKYCPMCGEKFK